MKVKADWKHRCSCGLLNSNRVRARARCESFPLFVRLISASCRRKGQVGMEEREKERAELALRCDKTGNFALGVRACVEPKRASRDGRECVSMSRGGMINGTGN